MAAEVWIVALYGAGFVLIAAGILGGWFDARRASGEAKRRRVAEQEINAAYTAAAMAVTRLLPGQEGAMGPAPGAVNALHPFHTAARAAARLPEATFAENDMTGTQSAERAASSALQSVRRDVIYVGAGTLVSTIASIWALAD